MTIPAATIPEMINQSIEVLTKPSVATFDKYEKRGGVQQAAIYIALASAISGLFGIVTYGGALGFLIALILTLVSFFLLTFLMHFIGRQMGGTGTYNEVAYSFALFQAPINVLVAILGIIPIIGALAAFIGWIAGIYFSYLAVQASMNFTDSGKVWTTLIGAWVINIIIYFVLSSILVAMVIGTALIASGIR